MKPNSRKLRKKIVKFLGSHIAQQIRSKRVEANLNQIELAMLIGYSSRQMIDNWERRESLPPLTALYLMSMVFNCSIEDFLPPVTELIEKVKITTKEVLTRAIVFDDEETEAPQ